MKSFYLGSAKHMIGVLIMSIGIFAMFTATYFAKVIDSAWMIWFFIAMFLCILYLNLDFFTKKVIISKEGVLYTSLTKKFELKWEEIKYVEVRGVSLFKNANEFLIFSTRYLSSHELMKLISTKEFIAMGNKNDRVLREVRKYWKGPIVGVEHIEYLNK